MRRATTYKTFQTMSAIKDNNEPQCLVIQNSEQFNDIISKNRIVCIDLYAPWCEPCKTVSPIFARLAEKYNRPGKCLLVKENTDSKIERSGYSIKAIPAFIFYIDGILLKNDKQGVVDVVGGDFDQIQSILNSLFAEIGENPVN